MPRRVSRFNPDGWVGPQLSVGANNERFYGGIRVDGDLINVGDAVKVKCEDRNDDQVTRVDAMWEDVNGNKCFEGRWYYRPDETTCGRLVGHDERELFETAHVIEDDIGVINGICTVMAWDDYQRWLDQPEDDDEEDEMTFVCRAAYHIGSGEFVPLAGASSLKEAERRGQQQQRASAAAGSKPPQQQHDGRGAAGAGAGGNKRPRGGGAASSWSDVLRDAEEQEVDGGRGGGGARGGKLNARDLYADPNEDVLVATGQGGVRRRRRLGRFAEAAARLAPSAAPERMPCREKERDEVVGVLRAAVLEGALGGSLYLSGTPGTGKTATVHQALRALAADKALPPFRTIFVNGMKLNSPFEVYTLLWENLTGQAVKPNRALELLEKRFAVPTASRLPFGRQPKQRRKGVSEKVILILDELDYLVTSRARPGRSKAAASARPSTASLAVRQRPSLASSSSRSPSCRARPPCR